MKGKHKQITAIVMAGMMLLQTMGNAVPVLAMNQGENVVTATSGNAQPDGWEEAVFEGEHFRAEFQVGSEWNEGYNGTITIINTSEKTIDNWYLAFDLADEIQNLQCGSIMQHEGTRYLVKNAGWNQDIPVGGSASFSFTAGKTGDTITCP